MVTDRKGVSLSVSESWGAALPACRFANRSLRWGELSLSSREWQAAKKPLDAESCRAGISPVRSQWFVQNDDCYLLI